MSLDNTLVITRAPSVARLFTDRVAATPDREAFRRPVGEGWVSMTWRETGEQVTEWAAGLLALGIQPEQRVAIISNTRVDWILADCAIMCAGAATTTVYPTTPAPDVAYIVRDSGSKIAFAEDDEQVAKLREHRAELPELGKVITFDGTADGDWVIGVDALAKLGRELLQANPAAVDDAIAAVNPESLATLIYTSGTTGRPKGVRLTHDCWTYEGAAIQQLDMLHEDDVQYLWLPLSHSFGKVLEAAQLAIGFSSAVDGRIPKLIENLAVVKPTFMAAAPRIFEKVHARVVTTVEEEGGVKLTIFNWAVGVGKQVSTLEQQGRSPSGVLAAKHRVADKLVFGKLRDRFGGNLRFLISGSAPLSRDIAEWFHGAGIVIAEGYGLTETSAGTFVNRPPKVKFGTVGPPMPGTEVRIAEDGEVLLRGPGNMRGYHNLPEETAATLDADGWLHTGDIGELDEDGFLRITDRKKDLIKTSGGKYVAPQNIETQFKAVCPYVSHMVVHGDGRNYCTALIAVDPEAIVPWAEQHGLGDLGYAELVKRPELREMLAQHVKELNEGLPRWETIKEFAILPADLTIEAGELTPSLKMKRRVVEQKYRPLLDGMYAGQR
ncbi:MAG TPA: long-chain fatty acid--CoA ligase [Actinomycetes bacterium]|nr:long-chain fatty acid--CoA ligase [Actinomycetes bacterium]